MESSKKIPPNLLIYLRYLTFIKGGFYPFIMMSQHPINDVFQARGKRFPSWLANQNFARPLKLTIFQLVSFDIENEENPSSRTSTFRIQNSQFEQLHNNFRMCKIGNYHNSILSKILNTKRLLQTVWIMLSCDNILPYSQID